MESPTERAIYTVRYAIAIMPVVQRGYNFEQASYMRWAGREVLIRLCKHPEIPPLIVFMCESTNKLCFFLCERYA